MLAELQDEAEDAAVLNSDVLSKSATAAAVILGSRKDSPEQILRDDDYERVPKYPSGNYGL